MLREDEPRPAGIEPDRTKPRPQRWLVVVLAALLVVVLVFLVLRPWTDGGGVEPVEAPGVTPSAPLPER